MTIALTRTDPQGTDREALVAFHTSSDFPFHVRSHPTAADVARRIDAGGFRDEDHDSWWVDVTEEPGGVAGRTGVAGVAERIGLVVIEDLQEPSPLLDLRLAAGSRGRGYGAPVLRAVTDHVFRTMPAVTRFEGQTREDNVAMRRLFLRCGWVKEAHYRESWPVEGGQPLASVAYAMLRRDWETGETTTFDWDDVTLDG